MKLYNTLSRNVEELPSPQTHKNLSFYACGPTVYDETHIGHMRKYVMDDILKRTLKFVGYDVKHVMNITDVGHLSGDDDSGEDKLEKGALKHGKTVWDVAKYYTDKFFETMDALNVIRPEQVVKATEHIEDMIKVVKQLDEKGFTYETSEAVYFDVTKFADYGKLSGQKLEDKKQAVREEVHIDVNKKNPADFALWFKRVGRFADHTMHWESPWGDGFPGWHIECSAMSMAAFNSPTIDIHSGGIDHIPIHHENEIAQSEAATGKKFVNYWVHHAFLKVNGEKMSKSKENFYTLKDLHAKKIDPLAIRYLFLQTHYRQEMNFTWEAVTAAEEAIIRIKKYIIAFREPSIQEKNPELISTFEDNFKVSIQNDLNTSQALSVMWEVMKSQLNSNEKLELLYSFDQVFGFGFESIKDTFLEQTIPDEILELANKRLEARKAKDFKQSDELREILDKKGFEIEDLENGYNLIKKQ